MANKPKLVADQQFKIIKGLAPPEPRRRSYPFADMEVGDAFDAPISLKENLSSATSTYGKRNGKKFSVRKLDENTLRVWRIA